MRNEKGIHRHGTVHNDVRGGHQPNKYSWRGQGSGPNRGNEGVTLMGKYEIRMVGVNEAKRLALMNGDKIEASAKNQEWCGWVIRIYNGEKPWVSRSIIEGVGGKPTGSMVVESEMEAKSVLTKLAHVWEKKESENDESE